MCTGAEVLPWIQAAAAAYGGYTAYQAAHAPSALRLLPSPAKVTPNPVADDTDAQTKAAQDAALAKLMQRERSRANSLLSAAGAAGDPSTPVLGRGEGKATFGA